MMPGGFFYSLLRLRYDFFNPECNRLSPLHFFQSLNEYLIGRNNRYHIPHKENQDSSETLKKQAFIP